MPKRAKNQENPYIGHIKMGVSVEDKDYSREEVGEEQFQRVLVRDWLSAMFHLHDIGKYDADIDGFRLKPDKP